MVLDLFDAWWERDAGAGVHIRFFDAVMRSLTGYWSGAESIGYGPVAGVTLCTDGSLEVHDVVRITGDGSTTSTMDVFSNKLDDVRTLPLWQELWDASLNLSPTCVTCAWHDACGGGHIASRWSTDRRRAGYPAG